MATWASCRVGNSPAARRRLASTLRWRRLGRPGSERDPPGMAVLPSRPGSARFGRERLAVDRSHAPGELAALPADPAAAGATVRHRTPRVAGGARGFWRLPSARAGHDRTGAARRAAPTSAAIPCQGYLGLTVP